MSENPRYPHFCRIVRRTASSPLVDEGGFTPIDNGYDPLGGDDDVSSSSSSSSEGEYVIESVVYEGPCRSYEKNTTSDKGEIITSHRGLALPLNQDGWDNLGVAPREGDEVYVEHGVFKEYGRVIDKNIATASFAGTHLVWTYGRN